MRRKLCLIGIGIFILLAMGYTDYIVNIQTVENDRIDSYLELEGNIILRAIYIIDHSPELTIDCNDPDFR